MTNELDEKSVEKNPVLQFRKWYSYAIMNSVQDAPAMVLSTVSVRGTPNSRVVYMRDIGQDGLVFFTNYNSRKAMDLSYHPEVSVNFFWQSLWRQVRIEGIAEKISAADSDAYFSLRERHSRIGAWASAQSEELESRAVLQDRFAKLTAEFDGQDVPRPEWWGGYKIVPSYFEFWLGRDSRLHDRIAYTFQPNGEWKIKRLYP